MDIIETFLQAKDDTERVPMEKYMKNQFPFLGLPTPKRKALSKAFLKERKQDQTVDWDLVFLLYEQPYREFHYLAIDYLHAVQKKLSVKDMKKIETLILTHSWWDTVDSIDGLVGSLYLSYPEEMTPILRQYMEADNIWLKRISIDFQLKLKEKTDTALLSEAIIKNMDTKEFFVNKAIGWALREYSKSNAPWVADFIESHPLSSLSKREGSKYL